LSSAEEELSEARERVGRVLNDKWALESVLGVGGMAAVYAARHRNGARAAVKVLHPDLARHGQVRERFLREGYAANRVEHPGVVKVLDDDVVIDGPDAGTAYIVMELLEGQSLQERLERGPPMGEREFLVLAAYVLDVLETAHARGVIHRDLKPENLFLVRPPEESRPAPVSGRTPLPSPSDAPRIKVLDFGLARLQEGQALTSYGLALGTPSFMSPEQAAGRIDEIDGRTDLFALAATGFRLRTGRRIHEAAHPVELVTKMANVPAPPVRTFAPDVTEAFARVIDRALQFRREDRYESAAAMLADVRLAIASLDAGASATQPAMEVAALARFASLPHEATIEVSRSDLAGSSILGLPSPPPAAGSAAEARKAAPRRGSFVGLLVLAAIFVGGLLAARRWLYPARVITESVLVDAAVPEGGALVETAAAAVPSVAEASVGSDAEPVDAATASEAGMDAAASSLADASGARAMAAAHPAAPTTRPPTRKGHKPLVHRTRPQGAKAAH
jgi:serine/threonine-protein kinase